MNSPPLAHAGPDQSAAVANTVQLDGSRSADMDGDLLSYAWLIASAPVGSTAAIVNPTAPRASLTLDVAGDYLLELTVNDGTVTSLADQVTISTNNSLPLADGGPEMAVAVGQTVLLRRELALDADGDEIEPDWRIVTRPAGSGAKPAPGNPKPPELTIDEPGTYVVRLDVEDGVGAGETALILLDTGNIAPVAKAGPDQTVTLNDLVALDGAGASDLDGDAIDYRWAMLSRPAGSTASLSDATAIRPEFSADLAGTYVVQLYVYDGTYPLPGTPVSLVVEDFNNDGIADVLALLEGTGQVVYLIGDGNGGFQVPVYFDNIVDDPAGTDFSAIMVADFNNDGRPDAIFGNWDRSAVTVMLGDFIGNSFQSPDYDHTVLVRNLDDSYSRTYKDGRVIGFDSNGLMVSDTDSNGNITQYAYDGQDRLTTITDPMNKVTTLAYPAGQVTVTDPASRVTTLDLDANGDLIKITDPDGTFRQFAYDAEHRLVSQTDKRSLVTTYDYNFAGHMITSHRPDGTIREAVAMNLAALPDLSAGEGTLGNPALPVRPEDAKSTFKDGNGNPVERVISPNGSPLQVSDSLGRSQSAEYDDDNNVTRFTDPRGYITEMTYDDLGNMLSRKEAVGTPEERLTVLPPGRESTLQA